MYIFLFLIAPFFVFGNSAMTDFGNLQVVSFGIQAPKRDENFLYQIIVIPYPENTFPIDSAELKSIVVQEFIDASHLNDNSEKIYQTEIQQSGMNFEQWVIHFGKEYAIKSRATLKDDRLYVVQVMTEFDNSVNTDIDKFLDSFQFLN
jgi:hypothetical protein